MTIKIMLIDDNGNQGKTLMDMEIQEKDDAGWIDKGTDEPGFSVRQLSGFHLACSCRRGWENGGDMYDAIRSGRIKSTLGTLKEREGKTAEKSRNYVLNRLEKGVD